MKKLALKDIAAGEVVARPITTGSGVILVQPGTALTADVLDRLGAFGVEWVWLEGTNPDARPLEELLAELDRRFLGYEDDELMLELKASVGRRIRLGAS
jgi:hypothetical protein